MKLALDGYPQGLMAELVKRLVSRGCLWEKGNFGG